MKNMKLALQLLYNELDQWRETETKRIKEAGGGERRQVALRELLHKETRLLQTIDRLKITASREGKVGGKPFVVTCPCGQIFAAANVP